MSVTSGEEVTSSYIATGNIEIFAHWIKKPVYEMSFEENGGSEVEDFEIEQGTSVGELPVITKEKNHFMGWYTENTFEHQIDETYKPESNKTFYAKWIKTIENANITNQNIELDVDEEETINITNPQDIEEEYTFTSDDETIATVGSNGKITGVSSGAATITIEGVTSGKTVNVNVSVKVTMFTVNFNTNGGREIEDRPVMKGSPIGELPIAYKDHYNFDGWYTTVDGPIQVDSSYRVSTDIEIFARYTAAEEYTIIFDANGGTVDEVSRQVTEDMPLGELPTPTRTNYYFGGWKDEVDNKFYTSNTQPTKDITLTAQWTEVEHVARITSTYYDSIQSAINAAQTNDEVVLLVDVTENPENDKKITINLNNHKVTGQLTNNSNGDLILLNGDIERIINSIDSSPSTVYNAGKLTIGSENPKLEDGIDIKATANNSRYAAYGVEGTANSTFTINGGNIITSSLNSSGIINNGAIGFFGNENSTITMNGGNITSTGCNIASGIFGDIVIINGGSITSIVEPKENGAVSYGIIGNTVIINGGIIKANGDTNCFPYGVKGNENSIIIMNGGSITAIGNSNSYGIYGSSNGTITVNGGSITSNNGIFTNESNSTIILNGGNITATTGITSLKKSTITINDVGIKARFGIYVTAGGTLTVNGGNITATATEISSNAYGIKSYGVSKTTINGGNITATAEGGNGSAYILDSSNSEIIIYGGTLKSSQTYEGGSGNAYGIYGATNSTITINGGSITTTGYNTAYGIYGNYKLRLTINEGYISVTSNGSSAKKAYGIYNIDRDIITINGGNIISMSTGSSFGAYGNISTYNGTNITMYDGTIYSKGKDKASSYGIENYQELILPEGKVLHQETNSDGYEVYSLVDE